MEEFSTLMTVAPSSAMNWQTVGPASTLASSTTTMPSIIGRGAALLAAAKPRRKRARGRGRGAGEARSAPKTREGSGRIAGGGGGADAGLRSWVARKRPV